MCGITGFFSKDGCFNSTLFAYSNNLIKYRGPDGFGYHTFYNNSEIKVWKDENLLDYKEFRKPIGAFGFRRLSIIDLSEKGNQPMTDVDSIYSIIFNGEIYNYIELKKELIQLGHHFKNNTDTEVIITAYKQWGEDCVKRFNGMWSFCIYNSRKNELFASRDRFGIKPFYFSFDGQKFIFGSEIKQIIPFLENKSFDESMLFDFICLGSYGNSSDKTYFKEIKQLYAGTNLILNLSTYKLKTEKYWDINSSKEPIINNKDKDIYNKIGDLLESSVALRLRSDVSVGTALSGGLDSSGIVGILNKLYNGNKEKNKVFTIISDDKSIKDPIYAKEIIDKIPVTSFISNFSKNSNLEELSKLLWHQEEPIQTASIFGSWNLYQFIAKNNIKVTLDGQGADELMGGYYGFPYSSFHIDLIAHGRLKEYFSQIKKLSKLHNSNILLIHLSVIRSFMVENFKKNRKRYY